MQLPNTFGASYRRRGVTRLPVLVMAVAVLIANLPSVRAAQSSRVVVLRTSEDGPSTDVFIEQLVEQLAPVEVRVDAETVEALPADSETWATTGTAFRNKKAGTLALIRLECGAERCVLTLFEPRSLARLEYPIEAPEGLTVEETAAATAREMLVSEMLPLLAELDRFAKEPDLDPTRVSPDRFFVADRGQFELDMVESERTLWLEGGYQGEVYHPGGDLSNGAWLGAVFAPTEILQGTLSLGWSGFREGYDSISGDRVDIHRAYASLGLRIAFAVGAAEISISPIARFDLVFADFEAAPGSSDSDTRFEMHAGGVTHWKLPLPWDLDALLGIGILATVVGDDYVNDSGNEAAERSALILYWQAGVAYSLF